jgi:small GTP-binding protein
MSNKKLSKIKLNYIYMNNTYSYKITLVGRSGVGKSSFAIRLTRDTFHEDCEATIGASFLTKIIHLNQNKSPSSIQLQIWDTAGQERYHSLVPMYTRNSSIVLLCTDSPHIKDLQEDLKTYRLNDLSMQIFIVITKMDQMDHKDFRELQLWADDMQYPMYFISSKTGDGISLLTAAIQDECLKLNPILSGSKSGNSTPHAEPSSDSKCCNQ